MDPYILLQGSTCSPKLHYYVGSSCLWAQNGSRFHSPHDVHVPWKEVVRVGQDTKTCQPDCNDKRRGSQILAEDSGTPLKAEPPKLRFCSPTNIYRMFSSKKTSIVIHIPRVHKGARL